MIKIGFVINFNIHKWFGGYNVIKNLISAIKINKPKNLKIILFVNKNLNKKFFKDLNVEIIKTDFFNKLNLIRRILTKIEIIIFGKSTTYENFFSKYNINLLSHSICLGRKSSIKSFYWITDFQHNYYPEYFTTKGIILRKLNNFFSITNSSKIILSSNNSLQDMKKISTKGYNKSFVNSFYFPNFKKKNLIPFKLLKKKFKLTKKFFYIPNQYWPHKNHLLVLKSLKYLTENLKTSVFIISSGQNYASGSKSYFNRVLDYKLKNKLEKNFRYLGIISDDEVRSLIYYSLAIINPSQFEGWNTSVMQARAMSKKILLSNIKVHKEQKYEKTIFFKNNDVKSLSISISKIWKKKQNFKINSNILKKNEFLFKDYGRNFLKVALNSIKNY